MTTKNERVRSVVVDGIKSSFRWFLSGTPRHANFNDIQILSSLLGVHLGIDELLPGTKFGRQSSGAKDSTGLESISQYLEVRSLQWHERRHGLAQSFLDRFVRQNVAEIDEIPYQEDDLFVDLPPAERAVRQKARLHVVVGLCNLLTWCFSA